MANQERTCRFTATGGGGWRLHMQGGLGAGSMPQGQVVVYRNGATYVDPGDTGADCASDVIRAGDQVEVTIRQGSAGYDVADMAAGTGYACGSR